MNTKPLSKTSHGLIDYVFAAALFTVPKLIDCNPKTVNLYRGIAFEVLFYSALSNHRLSAFPLIPMKAHKVIDLVNLSTLSLLTLYKPVRKSTRAKAFNLGKIQ